MILLFRILRKERKRKVMNENENDIHSVGDSSLDSESNSQSIEIDYEKIEECYYNALKRIQQEEENNYIWKE